MTDITAHHGLIHDVNLHVDDTGGTGRPVVLIHGWPLSGESWTHQIPVLRQAGYRVVDYDRRGFGRSDKPKTGYGYDTLADDLAAVLDALDLHEVTLVGFSMGGGEVARYVAKHGTERLHSVVFASAITPFLAHVPGNPDGPLELSEATRMTAQLTADRDAFFDRFMTDFFSVNGELVVSEDERQDGLRLAAQADKVAALEAMAAFGNTDFRDDLGAVTLPTLVIHGDGDAVVPFEGSGRRTHEAILGSELVLIPGGPHGVNVSHADAFNQALLAFLQK